MTRTLTHRVGVVLKNRRFGWGAWLLALMMVPMVPTASARDELPESNLALLERTLRFCADDLLSRAPLDGNVRIAVRGDDNRPVDKDVERAILAALTERQIEAWTLAPEIEAAATPATPADPFSAPVDTLAGTNFGGAGTPPSGAGSSNGPTSGEQFREQQAIHIPLLEFHVEEARVDYPRMFRTGVFGGQHVERRAIGRITAELLRPDSRAVYWVGSADTSYSDVVLRSDLTVLEDQSRPEARGTVPTQNWTKLAEPVLVGALVVGLVALFYTNRP